MITLSHCYCEEPTSIDAINTTQANRTSSERKGDLTPVVSVQDTFETFKELYCRCPLVNPLGILVYFSPKTFWHAFFEAEDRKPNDKSIFSEDRASRVHWIGRLILDPSAAIVCGFDRYSKRYTIERFVTVWPDLRYVVVAQLQKGVKNKAHFITAFYANNGSAISKIMTSPKWKN